VAVSKKPLGKVLDLPELILQDEHLPDQSHIIGAEMSVYDFNYEDDGYPVTGVGYPMTSAYSGSHDDVPPAVRWVEGYAAQHPVSSGDIASQSSGLKLRLSNRQIIGLVTIACRKLLVFFAVTERPV